MMWFSVLLVWVSVSVLFHPLCIWMIFLSVHLLEKSCSFGYPYVIFVLCLFVILIVSLLSSPEPEPKAHR